MANLAFIRSIACIDCWDYYESKTDVLVFGDSAGYAVFEEEIRLAASSEKNIHLVLAQRHPTSMRVVIIHAAESEKSGARLKLIERAVSDNNGPNMELVICGNLAGLEYLAETVSRVAREYAGDASEHIHLDDLNDPHLVPRSVSLNLRGPFPKWGPEGFGEYTELVLRKSKDFVPQHASFSGYEELHPKESDFLAL